MYERDSKCKIYVVHFSFWGLRLQIPTGAPPPNRTQLYSMHVSGSSFLYQFLERVSPYKKSSSPLCVISSRRRRHKYCSRATL